MKKERAVEFMSVLLLFVEDIGLRPKVIQLVGEQQLDDLCDLLCDETCKLEQMKSLLCHFPSIFLGAAVRVAVHR